MEQQAADLDQELRDLNEAVAGALAQQKNDDSNVIKLAAARITQIIDSGSTAALQDVNKQIEALRALGRRIERRRDALTDAAVEHTQFCHETCKSTQIMADAIEALDKSFANGLTPTLRLVQPGE